MALNIFPYLFTICCVIYCFSNFADARSEVALQGQKISDNWQFLARLHPSKQLRVLVHLRYRAQAEIDSMFWSVADPQSPSYRSYPSRSSLASMIGRSVNEESLLNSWLLSSLSAAEIHWSPLRDHIEILAPAHKIERLFKTNIHIYRHNEQTDLFGTEASSLSIPPSLTSIISHVGGQVRLPSYIQHNIKLNQHNIDADADADNKNNKNNKNNDFNVFSGITTNGALATVGLDNKILNFALLLCPDNSYATNKNGIFTCPQQYTLLNVDYQRAFSTGTIFPPSSRSFASIGVVPSPSSLLTFTAAPALFGAAGTGGWAAVNVDAPDSPFYLFNYRAVITWTNGLHQQQVTVTNTNNVNAYPILTAAFIKTFYGVDPSSSSVQANRQAIISLNLGGTGANASPGQYNQADLLSFLTLNGLPASLSSLVTIRDFTQNNTVLPDGETELDIQFMTGISPNATTFNWHPSNDDSNWDDCLATMLTANETAMPFVVSISYGEPEIGAPDIPLTESLLYDVSRVQYTITNQFKVMALQGITVLASSGDTGTFNMLNTTASPDCTTLAPSFPASSPYILSVGASSLSSSPSNRCPHEVPCSILTGSIITVGGGTSVIFPMPEYQRSVATKYLANASCVNDIVRNANLYNASGRVFPDITLFGHSYGVIISGKVIPVDGTSASSPALGGFLSLINSRRLELGLAPLGFINPTLYALQATNAKAFNDITEGENGCNEQSCVCAIPGVNGTNVPAIGFQACTGYDAVSGLGSPNFSVLAPLLVPGGLPHVLPSNSIALAPGCPNSFGFVSPVTSIANAFTGVATADAKCPAVTTCDACVTAQPGVCGWSVSRKACGAGNIFFSHDGLSNGFDWIFSGPCSTSNAYICAQASSSPAACAAASLTVEANIANSGSGLSLLGCGFCSTTQHCQFGDASAPYDALSCPKPGTWLLLNGTNTPTPIPTTPAPTPATMHVLILLTFRFQVPLSLANNATQVTVFANEIASLVSALLVLPVTVSRTVIASAPHSTSRAYLYIVLSIKVPITMNHMGIQFANSVSSQLTSHDSAFGATTNTDSLSNYGDMFDATFGIAMGDATTSTTTTPSTTPATSTSPSVAPTTANTSVATKISVTAYLTATIMLVLSVVLL